VREIAHDTRRIVRIEGLTERMSCCVGRHDLRSLLLTVYGNQGRLNRMRALVGMSSSETHSPALDLTANLRFTDATVTLAHVLDLSFLFGITSSGYTDPDATAEIVEGMREAGQFALAGAKATATHLGLGIERTVMVSGSSANELMVLADESDADLIAVTARSNSGIEHLVLGSTARKLVNGFLHRLRLGSTSLHCAMHAQTPVLSLRPQVPQAASGQG
jgi:nucleotide-binding universal stress UspA family protein